MVDINDQIQEQKNGKAEFDHILIKLRRYTLVLFTEIIATLSD